MLFNSFEFLLFFPLVTLIYFLLPHKFRWFHLLVASCIFYMYFVPIYILVLFLTIIIDYIAGIMIENASGNRRKWFLVMSIFANVGVLAVFKYYNFFIENVNAFFHLTNVDVNLPLWNIILPIGLSFHTFQAMSYTIEVYRGHQKAERHFGVYALYVMFYPQLVAGPIERPQNLLPQFHTKQYFKYEDVVSGLRLMMWGLIKKVVIADRIALVTDPLFRNPHQYSGTALALGSAFFSFQIFCDFSGYSDIAIGSARVMGFKLMTNFNTPYNSRSIAEFWKRWHISLSTWFKDYLYISMGGNRVAIPRVYFNLFVVFIVSGLWHGANWTYIVYGALQGTYMVVGMMTKPAREKMAQAIGLTKVHWLNNSLNVIVTFALICFSWPFFRAQTITDTFYIVRKFADIPHEIVQVFTTGHIAFLNLPGIFNVILPCLGLIIFLETAHIVQKKYQLAQTFSQKPAALRWSLYFAGQAALFFLGVYEKHQFIYFQF